MKPLTPPQPSKNQPSKKPLSKKPKLTIKLTSPTEAKMVLQSYVLTTARYDFSIYEKRILYYCVKEAQQYLSGLRLNRFFDITSLIEEPSITITMPISAILQGEDDKNHFQVKRALYSLLDKKIVYQDKSIWTAFTMVERPSINITGETATFKVNPILWACILDFSQGFHPFELQVAMRFSSVYSMRFYELVSNPKNEFRPVFSIDTIKSWFGLENKYSNNNDFLKRVIVPAQKELDQYSPWSFDFKVIKEGRKFSKIQIIPRSCPNNGSKELQDMVEKRRTSLLFHVSDENARKYLRQTLGFTDVELKNELETLHKASQLYGEELYRILKEKYIAARKLKEEGRLSTSEKAYIIGALKKMLQDTECERDDSPTNTIDSLSRILANSLRPFEKK